jgi:hypothetical protein
MSDVTECAMCGKEIEATDDVYKKNTEPTCDKCQKLIEEGREDEIE